MKNLEDYVYENIGQPIDDNWLDNEKPVQTKDGRIAVVLDVDISKVPNVIIGQVKNDNVMTDYKWSDDGTCIYATDKHGNPYKPSDDDMLVKGM